MENSKGLLFSLAFLLATSFTARSQITDCSVAVGPPVVSCVGNPVVVVGNFNADDFPGGLPNTSQAWSVNTASVQSTPLGITQQGNIVYVSHEFIFAEVGSYVATFEIQCEGGGVASASVSIEILPAIQAQLIGVPGGLACPFEVTVTGLNPGDEAAVYFNTVHPVNTVPQSGVGTWIVENDGFELPPPGPNQLILVVENALSGCSETITYPYTFVDAEEPVWAKFSGTLCEPPGCSTVYGSFPGYPGLGTWIVVEAPPAANVTIANPNAPTTDICGITETGNYWFVWSVENECFSDLASVFYEVIEAPILSGGGQATLRYCFEGETIQIDDTLTFPAPESGHIVIPPGVYNGLIDVNVETNGNEVTFHFQGAIEYPNPYWPSDTLDFIMRHIFGVADAEGCIPGYVIWVVVEPNPVFKRGWLPTCVDHRFAPADMLNVITPTGFGPFNHDRLQISWLAAPTDFVPPLSVWFSWTAPNGATVEQDFPPGLYEVAFRIESQICPETYIQFTFERPEDITAFVGTDLEVECGREDVQLIGQIYDELDQIIFDVEDIPFQWLGQIISGGPLPVVSDLFLLNPVLTDLVPGEYEFFLFVGDGYQCEVNVDSMILTVPGELPDLTIVGPPEVCRNHPFTLVTQQPPASSGTWTVLPNPLGAVTFDPDVHSPNPTVLVTQPGVYTFTWTVSNQCDEVSAEHAVTVGELEGTGPIDAGPDQCVAEGALSVQLQATVTPPSTGVWTLLDPVNALGVQINSPTDPNTTVTIPGTAETYVFQWTVVGANPKCGEVSDEVTVSVAGEIIQADAGPNQTVCHAFIDEPVLTLTLSGNDPGNASGHWESLPSTGITFIDPANPQTDIQLTVPGLYQLTWVLDYGACGQSQDSMTVFTYSEPAVESSEITICGVNAVQLNGNGINGVWTTSSASAVIVDPMAATSWVSNLIYGAHTFVWTSLETECSGAATVTVNAVVEGFGGDQEYTSCGAWVPMDPLPTIPLSALTYSPELNMSGWPSGVILPAEPGTYTIVHHEEVGDCVIHEEIILHSVGGTTIPNDHIEICNNEIIPLEAVPVPAGSEGTWFFWFDDATGAPLVGNFADPVENPINSFVQDPPGSFWSVGDNYQFYYRTEVILPDQSSCFSFGLITVDIVDCSPCEVEVVCPEIFSMECDEEPNPSITGYPAVTIGGTSVDPVSLLVSTLPDPMPLCDEADPQCDEVYISYTDSPFGNNIFRTWTVDGPCMGRVLCYQIIGLSTNPCPSECEVEFDCPPNVNISSWHFTTPDVLGYPTITIDGVSIDPASVLVSQMPNPMPACDDSSNPTGTTWVASNADPSSDGYPKAIYLDLPGFDFSGSIENGSFTESGGSATLSGTIVDQNNPLNVFALDLAFSSFSDDYPSPITNPDPGCNDTSDWTFYHELTGTMTGTSGDCVGVEFDVSLKPGGSGTVPWQQGVGANIKNCEYGGAAWILLKQKDCKEGEAPQHQEGDKEKERDDKELCKWPCTIFGDIYVNLTQAAGGCQEVYLTYTDEILPPPGCDVIRHWLLDGPCIEPVICDQNISVSNCD